MNVLCRIILAITCMAIHTLDSQAEQANGSALLQTQLRRANLYLNTEQQDLAIVPLTMAYYLSDQPDRLAETLGDLHAQLGDVEQARYWLNQIATPEPNRLAKRQLQLAKLALANHDRERFESLIKPLAQSDRLALRQEAFVLQGHLAYQQNRLQEATDLWEKAVEMGNVDVEILTFLGSYYYQQHHVEKACQYLLPATVQSSLPADLQALLIQALIQTQQWPQAREQLIVYLESFGMDPRVRELIALLANNPNRQ